MGCVALSSISAFYGSAGSFQSARAVGFSQKFARDTQVLQRSADIRPRICACRTDVSHQ